MSIIPSEYFLHLGTQAKMKDITTFLDKHNCLSSFMLMCANNQSPYLSGYHGISHIIRCLTTLYYIHQDYKNITDWNSIIEALIWHDFNYINPNNDSTNTEVALEGYLFYHRLMYNKVPEKIESYINVLEFPYTYHVTDNNLIEYQIIRDCDMSMILYEDYFETMYSSLLKYEFKNKNNLVESAMIFIDNLIFYNEDLKNRLEKIGKDYLKHQAIKYILSEQKGE